MFHDSPVAESFRYSVERMVEEEQTQDGYEMSTAQTAQLNMEVWQPRITGIITCISSLCMLLMAWKRKNLLFHRLVLGKKKDIHRSCLAISPKIRLCF